jgi:hypothetical protein
METDIEIGGIVHDILIDFNCLAKALLLYESQSDISFDFELHLFVLVRCAVKRHIVHLNCLVVLLLFKENVAHIHSQTTRLRVLLVFENDSVAV